MKIALLRKSLAELALAAYLQPVNDEYMSEYPPACNRRVEWISGFSGSAGTVVIATQKAALFTDGRYTLQAKNEVDGAVFEQHNSGTLAPEAWLAEHLSSPSPAKRGRVGEGALLGEMPLVTGPLPTPPPQAGEGIKVGYDPKLYTSATLKRMQSVLSKKNIELVPVANLIDPIWTDRPATPQTPLFIHELQYAGETSADKRSRIARQLTKDGVDIAVIAAPDAVCWLLNIRARDVENTPLALSVALINNEGAVQLFIDPKRCSAEVSAHLGNQVEVCDPSTLEQRLLGLGTRNVLCDPASVPVWFTQTLTKAGAKIIEGQELCLLPKAMKNAVELQGIRNAHIRDGVAIVKLLCWLDNNQSVSEMEVSDKLRSFRALSPMFVEPSFTTIAGSGPNGAIVHYRVTEQSNRQLQPSELFLLDSGGQYPDGTTDITRTIPIGTPGAEHKDRFTRVLKGHIAIATARFPEGTSGSQLDILARQYLWQAGLDYDHGTGHGVGCFLGVHEGPQRISKRGGDAVLKAGMVVSNEPGYYKTGEYGIRIENLVAVTTSPSPLVGEGRGEGGLSTNSALSVLNDPPLPKPLPQGERGYLAFDTLTCAPLDTRLVDIAQLTADEKTWLNNYNAWVLKSLANALEPQEKQWLEVQCKNV